MRRKQCDGRKDLVADPRAGHYRANDAEEEELPSGAEGDDDSLLEVDNPGDVDLYRHGKPPPGFHRATVVKPRHYRSRGSKKKGPDRGG